VKKILPESVRKPIVTIKVFSTIKDISYWEKKVFSKTETTILKMLYSGLGHREIASTCGCTLEGYYVLYVSLLAKTYCWDEAELCNWWLKNKQ
jgi:hypothetical protein